MQGFLALVALAHACICRTKSLRLKVPKMTREKRHELLKKKWNEMPVGHHGITDQSNFWGWQGLTATLLSFNPQLQNEFRDTIKRVSEKEAAGGFPHCENECDRILAILSEAINETGIAEEKPALVLTDEHGIWWFINHCTWKSRLTFFGWLALAALTVFGVGFRLGQTEWARNLYRQYESLPSPAPTVPPTTAHPNK
jgi:hypothetical protein